MVPKFPGSPCTSLESFYSVSISKIENAICSPFGLTLQLQSRPGHSHCSRFQHDRHSRSLQNLHGQLSAEIESSPDLETKRANREAAEESMDVPTLEFMKQPEPQKLQQPTCPNALLLLAVLFFLLLQLLLILPLPLQLSFFMMTWIRNACVGSFFILDLPRGCIIHIHPFPFSTFHQVCTDLKLKLPLPPHVHDSSIVGNMPWGRGEVTRACGSSHTGRSKRPWTSPGTCAFEVVREEWV